MNRYKTLKNNSEALFKEKGSKFLGYAYPIRTENDIEHTLLSIKAKHPKATHHCYAYKLGLEDSISRAQDDGEPNNSAGKPILGQIESNELFNVLIIVVRYYGGTKLGVGGLQIAYKTAARLAIEANEFEEKEVPTFYTIKFPFDLQGIVDHSIKNLSGIVLNKSFNQACEYQVQIPKEKSTQFEERIASQRNITCVTES